jgi:nicotinamide mononucleotide transporter
MTLFGQTTSWLEIVAFISGFASVWLTMHAHVANWPTGLVSVACFIFLFIDAKLYADAALQIAFIVLGIYGWWKWSLKQSQTNDHLRIARTTWQEVLVLLLLCIGATAAIAAWLASRSDSPLPIADSSILVFSLAATWWQARSRIESWFVWIGVDILSIPIYWSRDLKLTAVLYAIFLLVCFGGWYQWRKKLSLQAIAV